MKFLATLTLLLSFSVLARECDQDAKKFCASVDPGRGQLAKCLNDYQGQLSPACAKELKDFGTKSTGKNPCFNEIAEFCTDVPADNNKIEYCLMKNESKLGAKCAADFAMKKPNITVRDVCAQDVVNNCYSSVSESDGAIFRCLIKNKAKTSPFCQKRTDLRIAEMK